MAALVNAFDKVKSGSGQIAGIVGEAGVGKSRLLLEMRSVLPQAEFVYLEGRCLHYGGSMPYLPILDILRSYFEIKEGDREFLIKKKMKEKILDLDESLKDILTPFQELLSVRVDEEAFGKLDPKVKRERTFEAIRDLFVRVSQEKTLIIAIEDLHWIDKTTEEFLDYLIGWLANISILLILLYRPDYTHQWGSKSYYTQISLDQLGIESSSELIRAILEEGEVAPELRQLILNRAAGNPLFMEEFTYTLLENGSIEKRNEQYVLNRKPSDIQVPDTIQAIIAARIDRLEESLKRIMQVASVIGREFAFRILQTIIDMRDELKVHLLNLQRLEFIYEKSLFPELEYIFKHSLTQEVAYNSLLSNRRKDIHRRIGKAIEELYAESLAEFYEVLAYHYERAEIPDKAIRYLTKAGDRARSIFANEQAIVFYQAAIDQLSKFLTGKVESPEDLCKTATQLHESLGDVLEWTGQHDKARDALMSALTQAPKHDLIWQARLHRKTGNIFRLQHRQGDSIRAYNLAESKLGVEPIGSDPEWWQEWIQIHLERMSLYYWVNQWHKISELADKLQPIVEQYGQPTQRVNFFLSLGNMNNRRDRYVVSEQTLALCRSALAIGQEADNPRDIAWAKFLLGFGHLWRGEFDQAEEQMQAALAIAERTGDTVHLARCLTYLTILYRKRSQVEEARHYVSRSLSAATAAQTLEIVATAKANLAWIAWREENLPEAEVKGRAALDLWQQLPVSQAIYPFQWTALWPLIGVALEQESKADAVDYARAMLEPSQQSLPDALNLVLEKVIKTFEGGELEKISIHLNHAIELAQELGYL
jgi:tetratricopeptide (TPR) repeat protein